MRFFRKILSLGQTWPESTLSLSALLVFASIFFLPRLQFDLSLFDAEDPAFPSTGQLQSLKESFEDGNRLLLVFHRPSRTGGQGLLRGSDVCRISEWIGRTRLFSEEIGRVGSVLDIRKPEFKSGHLWYPQLFPNPCAKPGEIADFRVLRDSPWSLGLASKYYDDLAVEVEFREKDPPGPFGKFDPGAVRRMIASLQSEVLSHSPGLSFLISGETGFQWHFAQAMSKDAWVNLLAIVLFVLFFRSFYGTWKSGFLFAGILILSAILVYGPMAALGFRVTVLTQNLFLMACIAGIEDYLYLSEFLWNREGTWRDAFHKMAVPGFFTSATTAVGFASLASSELHLIREFGICAGYAAMVEWAVTFLLLPALCRFFGEDFNWTRPERSFRPRWLYRMSEIRMPRGIARVSIGLFLIAAMGAGFLRYENSPSKNFSESHPQSQGFAYLRQSRGWEMPISLVFSAGVPDERRRGVLQEVSRIPNVTKVESDLAIADYLTQGLPQTTADLVRREFTFTSMYKRFNGKDGRTRAVLFLKSADMTAIEATLSSIRAICPSKECIAVGKPVVYRDYSNTISKTMIQSFLVSLILVIGVLWALARRYKTKHYSAIVLSALWCPVIVLGVVALVRFPINLITCMFPAIIVGMTGDNTVQYICATEGDDGAGLDASAGRKSSATMVLGLLLACSSMLFVLETLAPVRQLGALFAFSFVVTIIGDLWFLRGLLGEK